MRLLRKTVAMALVLIIGAAVVLWYGNTLNSWVVGGLIGGFAALLLSIPISLVLFSYFSRHYDTHQQKGVLERGDSLLLRVAPILSFWMIIMMKSKSLSMITTRCMTVRISLGMSIYL